jgi:hypothetical protein
MSAGALLDGLVRDWAASAAPLHRLRVAGLLAEHRETASNLRPRGAARRRHEPYGCGVLPAEHVPHRVEYVAAAPAAPLAEWGAMLRPVDVVLHNVPPSLPPAALARLLLAVAGVHVAAVGPCAELSCGLWLYDPAAAAQLAARLHGALWLGPSYALLAATADGVDALAAFLAALPHRQHNDDDSDGGGNGGDGEEARDDGRDEHAAVHQRLVLPAWYPRDAVGVYAWNAWNA